MSEELNDIRCEIVECSLSGTRYNPISNNSVLAAGIGPTLVLGVGLFLGIQALGSHGMPNSDVRREVMQMPPASLSSSLDNKFVSMAQTSIAAMMNQRVLDILSKKGPVADMSYELSTNSEGTLVAEWKRSNKCLGIGFKANYAESFWYYYSITAGKLAASDGLLTTTTLESILENLY